MKTAPNNKDVVVFLNQIENETKKADSFLLLNLLKKISGESPVMWGDSIVGFGKYHYVYDSGREGDMFLTGFSPRKQNIVVYIMNGCRSYKEDLSTLGKHRTGSSCLYLTKLDAIDLTALEKIISHSVALMRTKYA